ncbi:prenyltransferase [Thiomicrospira cyclica]|uniref:UbiA prenyltransferase n=1 Tax=Thiomicrospira cyclica (strain DSM 14477 / JCM 11371 / ALM1) TaxID=717773 RepID=F6DCD3_THICA|nr:prenyltransferase [Thiomicrospira cyclica]AEG31519.1 UbiA prenyltransferase [Thiomicrospira cyclica ALM1]
MANLKIRQTRLAVLYYSSRPNFLILTALLTALTIACLYWAGYPLSSGLALLVTIAALLVHAIVNWFNEVYDARAGLDNITQRTPFNGGSGSLQLEPEAINFVERVALGALGAVILFGFYIVWLWDWRIVPLGLLGLLVIFSYSPWMTRHPFLGWSSPGFGLGVVMMMGIAFALTGAYPVWLIAVTLLPFLLINNLLLLNQFPDQVADQKVGRRTLPLAIGDRQALRVFKITIWVSLAWLLLLIIFQALPVLSIIALVGFLPALGIWAKLQPGFTQTPDAIVVLRQNVVMILGVIILLTLSLVISAWLG